MTREDREFLKEIIDSRIETIKVEIKASSDISVIQFQELIKRQDMANSRTEKIENKHNYLDKKTRFAQLVQKKWITSIIGLIAFILIVHQFITWEILIKWIGKIF